MWEKPDFVASTRPATPPQLVYNVKNDETISIPVLTLQGKNKKCPAIRVSPGRDGFQQMVVFTNNILLLFEFYGVQGICDKVVQGVSE